MYFRGGKLSANLGKHKISTKFAVDTFALQPSIVDENWISGEWTFNFGFRTDQLVSPHLPRCDTMEGRWRPLPPQQGQPAPN